MLVWAQAGQQWTKRRNLGFEGPVRSVMTTVQRPNPDPRPSGKRTLIYSLNPDWSVFDPSGTLIEKASVTTAVRIVEISRRTVKSDGTEVWTDSKGQASESRKQETRLPDGSRETTYYSGSKIESREVSRFDEKGRMVESRDYAGKGHLTSEESSVYDDEGETDTWKIYHVNGAIAQHWKTRVTRDKSRFDRWEYDPQGDLGWHVAVNDRGELLSYWYRSGYKPQLSSSDSLGICRPKLCVDYKFNPQGQLEKTVQHTRGDGNLAPDDEEHFNGAGEMDEKIEMTYTRDAHGNWTKRSVFVWDPATNDMVEVERDLRKVEYY